MTEGAILTIVSGFVSMTTMVVGFLTLWVKLKYSRKSVEFKIDDNTRITKEGTQAATDNAKMAANTADRARVAAEAAIENINEQLNGNLTKRIHAVVKEHFDPLEAAVNAHAMKDEKNMAEIKKLLSEVLTKM